MYKIFADDTLIYDSTDETWKIAKGSISLETNKSGSFTFSLYPDHFFYDKFVRLKTVITVYKSGKIVFRGRILSDVTDHWNNKVITCEGELGFLQDSIIRPFSFSGTPEALFKKFVNEHNSQVDAFKRFKIGTVTVKDPNGYIARTNTGYETTLSNLNSRLIEDSLGGYFYITHGNGGTDPTPTLNYLADFTKVAAQRVEFGSNLKNYTKTVKADTIATAIIPLGHEVDDGNDKTENPKLTIASVNGGVDYVYSKTGVSLYGWIFKVVAWDDVTVASILKSKAEAYLEGVINQNVTIELTAIDLHLLDSSIESFSVCDYIRVTSAPHNFDSTLLCNKQTIDLLKPENDTITLGYTYSTLTEKTSKLTSSVSTINNMRSAVNRVSTQVTILDRNYQTVDGDVSVLAGDIESVAAAVVENATAIKTNGQAITALSGEIDGLSDEIDGLSGRVDGLSAANGTESTTYPGCYYKTVNGVTEWINPPLVYGTEFRTTERYGAKVVYLKRIDFGNLPSNTTKTVSIGVAPSKVVSVEGYSLGDYLYPIPGGNAGSLCDYWYIDSDGKLGVRTLTTELTNHKVYFTIKYVKS